MEKSKHFVRAYWLLTRAAANRQMVTYSNVAAIIGLPPQESHMGRVTGQVPGAFVLWEQACGQPLLSTVAAASTNTMPGPEFCGLAEERVLLVPTVGRGLASRVGAGLRGV